MMPILIVSSDYKQSLSYLNEIKLGKYSFYEIKPESKEYSIKEIKNLFKETGIFHKQLRVYFLENFQQSSIEAQNAFLKLLEEPPNNVLFVLTTDNRVKLLPTILSRVKIVYLNKKNPFRLSDQIKSNLEKFIESGFLNLIFIDQVSLDEIILFFRNRLAADKNATKILKEVLRLKNLSETNNLNQQLTIDHISILIKKFYQIKRD